MFKVITILVVACLLASGCAHFKPSSRNSSDHSEFDADSLWRQGYGFDNPNSERLRNGQTPLNFNGQENSIENQLKNSAGAFVGQMMLDTVMALGEGFWSKVTGAR